MHLKKGPDIQRIWVWLFVICFLFVPLTMIYRSVLYVAPFFAFFIFVTIRFTVPRFPLVLFLLALILRIFIVRIVPTPVQSDYAVLLDAAMRMNEGDMSFLDSGYFQLWSYQMGFVLYEALMLRIWNGVGFLRLINCFVTSGTVLLVYLIAREFASEKASRFVSLIYCFFPFPLFYVTILSNQYISSFLIYAGVYFLISDRFRCNQIVKYFLFAVVLVLADVLRPESIIPLFSAMLYLLLTLNKANRKQNLVCLLVMIAVYSALSALASQLFVWSGVSPLGLSNNAPYWKFLAGLNAETGGYYSYADEPLLGNPTAAWTVIKERALAPFPDLYKLFESKIDVFWSGYGLDAVFPNFRDSGLWIFGINFRTVDDEDKIEALSCWIPLIFYLLTALGVFSHFRKANRAERNPKVLLLANQVFVTLGVYLLIEIQTRYSYHVMISAAILAALGIDTLRLMWKRLRPRDTPAE